MRKFLKGIKDDLEGSMQRFTLDESDSTISTQAVSATTTTPPHKEDWLKYRKHRGVNLGSWFTLERWITDTPFRQAAHPAASDLDVAKGTNAKEISERHWDTWITQRDWDWMDSMGINSVRIPIGYYHVCGADRRILDDTDFYPFYGVYEGAWRRITDAIVKASRMNMTVLIDLHAAPGKQNADPHSGTSLSANFFNDPHNLRRGLYAITSLARALNHFCSCQSPPLINIIGIELLNEPAPPNDGILREWYLDAVAGVRREYPGIPIYLGEVWRLESYAHWASKEQRRLSCPGSTGLGGGKDAKGALVVLDHHLYRCFTPEDNRTSVQDHTRALLDPNGSVQRSFATASEILGRAGGGMIVGEWSCGLNPASLRGTHGERKAFVEAQLALYEKYCGGWYWWTLKKESEVYGKDVGWSLKDAVEADAFPNAVPGMKRRIRLNDSAAETERRAYARDVARRNAYDTHVAYWRRVGGSYEHHRFFAGFTDGWDDAYSFFDSVAHDANIVSEIGFTSAWAKERARGSDHENARGYWEYEHGIVQGIGAARADFEKRFSAQPPNHLLTVESSVAMLKGKFFYDVVTLKVENKLYRVPRHHLETWSQVFNDMFSLPPGPDAEGNSEDNPIVMSGCTSKEFESLMEVILTPTLIEPVILSKEGWVAVLKLSTMWDMPKVRKLAVEKLSSFSLSPTENVILGRTYKVRSWFLSGCQSLVEDRDPNSGLDSLASSFGWEFAARIAWAARLLPASGHSSVLTSTSPKQLNWACVSCSTPLKMEYTKPSRPAMNSMVPAAMYLGTVERDCLRIECICPKPGCTVGIRFEKRDYNIKMELPTSTILTSKPLDTGAAIVGRTFAEELREIESWESRASLASPNAM